MYTIHNTRRRIEIYAHSLTTPTTPTPATRPTTKVVCMIRVEFYRQPASWEHPTPNWYLCTTNTHMHRQTCFQKISCLVFGQIFGTHDDYTHTHFVMTDTNLHARRKRLNTQPLRRTLCLLSSVSMVSRDCPVCTGIRAAELGCGLSPE